ncbi:MAG: aminotransferase class V-fold PLP-dependent enzyme [Planctomycetota bacterium]|nr:aminotransferase class V-fold PLP-dependent enzyme [Planctomycetota bacterium]
MPSRREFLGALSVPLVGGASLAASNLPDVLGRLRELASDTATAGEIAAREDFWAEVARAFTVDRSIVNLNNGGVSPATKLAQDAMKRHLDFSHEAPSYNMWRVLEPRREGVRKRLAREWDVDAEEVAITRNASEGLQICQLGIDLRAGDEVLTTNQDYPRMITTFRQRERREGIVMKRISIPTPCEDAAEIVRRFEEAISKRTKLILMCHVINITGQVLPVRDVVQMARRRGIPVIVDGAHALGHLDFKISHLDCDYYATSLHKWLSAPHGTGLLYVRQNKIEGLWPMMAADDGLDADIRKFEQIGTHPAANALAIAEALTFHQGIGGARKEARYLYLRDYWAKRLVENDRFRLHTSLKPGFSSGIANVQLRGIAPAKLASWLWDKHRIHTTCINHDEFRGLRISPGVYTTLEELGRFCEAMEHAARHGVT